MRPTNQMIPTTSLTGIILAGGQSSRMGSDKALVKWQGKELYKWVLAALEPVCDRILISSNSDPSLFEGYEVVADRFTGIGPLAGIESGLYYSTTPFNVVVSCDSPLLTTAFFSYLLERHGEFDITLAAHDGMNEPLIGIYSKRIHPLVLEQIQKQDFRPPALIRRTSWQELNLGPELNFYQTELFRNMNRPEDLDLKQVLK